MAWRDNLRPASFRGISFFVEGYGLSGGRNIAKHEFPKRESHSTQDTGRKARSFSIDAFLIGDNYHIDRDNLLDVLDEEGSGILIHPYLGRHDLPPIFCTVYFSFFCIKQHNIPSQTLQGFYSLKMNVFYSYYKIPQYTQIYSS